MSRLVSICMLLVAMSLGTELKAQIPYQYEPCVYQFGAFFSSTPDDYVFDLSRTNYNYDLYTGFYLHLVLMESPQNLSAYEMLMEVSVPSTFIPSWTEVPGSGWTNIGTIYNHIAAFSFPQPNPNGYSYLGRWSLFPLHPNVYCEFRILPSIPSSLQGAGPALVVDQVLWRTNFYVEGFDGCDEPLPPGVFPPFVATTWAHANYDGPNWFVDPIVGSDQNNGSEELPFRTIQRAVDAAISGQVVVLADGDYMGGNNVNIDLYDKSLTISSATGDPSSCRLLAGGLGGFTFTASNDTGNSGPTFQGISIRDASIALSINGGWLSSRPIAEVINCQLAANGTAILGSNAAVILNNSVLNDNIDYGCRIEDGYAIVDETVITGNGMGLSVSDAIRIAVPTMINRVQFVRNGVGSYWGTSDYSVTFVECRFDSNGIGLIAESILGADVHLEGCQVTDNDSHGVVLGISELRFSATGGTRIAGNNGHGIKAIHEFGSLEIVDSTIRDNGGWGVQHVLEWVPPGLKRDTYMSTRYVRSEIIANETGGIYQLASVGTEIVLEGSLIALNRGDGVRLITDGVSESSGLISSTTIAMNDATGVFSDLENVTIERTLVAFNGARGVDLDGANSLSIGCTNIYGNGNGDWDGAIAALNGDHGNFSLDPLFCDPSSGEFGVLDHPLSPCLPGNHPAGDECGVIGSEGAQCLDEKPWFLALTDVPGDQGRQARLVWAASYHDRPGVAQPVVGYAVYRKGQAGAFDSEGKDGVGIEAGRSSPLRRDGWEYILTVPSRGDPGYQVIAPTLCDSTDAGVCWTHFLVSAVTSDQFTYYDSLPDSVYTIDNLYPHVPRELVVHYRYAAGETNWLEWTANDDPDIREYRIYRRTDVQVEVLVGSTTGTTWHDQFNGLIYEYRITAVDLAGNASEPAQPQATTAVEDNVISAPQRTAIEGIHPNPCNPIAHIEFSLERAGAVTVKVYDLNGRLTKVVASSEAYEAGRHRVAWHGDDHAGRPVASGRYVCVFEANGVKHAQGVTLIK